MKSQQSHIKNAEKTHDILIVGGGRWAQVYAKEIIELSKYIPIQLSIASQTNHNKLTKIIKTSKKAGLNICISQSIPSNKYFDLAIVATTVQYHLLQAMQIYKYCRTLLIEKPLFLSLDEHYTFNNAINCSESHCINSMASCPYLFSKSLHKQEKCNGFIESVEGIWEEPMHHPLGHKYDERVDMSAIPHLIPIVGFLVNADLSMMSIGEITKNSVKLKISNRNCSRICFSRGLKINDFEKSIKVKLASGEELALDLNSKNVKEQGINYEFNDIIPEDGFLTPLKSQVLYCLSEMNKDLSTLIEIRKQIKITQFLEELQN